MGVDLSVVIPAYNEEENVVPLYNELHEVLPALGMTYEILFVDDGSTDRTYQRLKELHDLDNTVRIVKFRSNFGQSAAMKAGLDYAAGDRIVTMDADLQNDPYDIPALLRKMDDDELDVVCGWRYNRHDPASKKFFSKGANHLRKIFTQETIHDSGCTLRAYRRECTRDLELYGELHRYIPAMLLWKGYHVGEMKTNHRDRSFGKSKYNWGRLFKGFLDLQVITFWQRYSVRPMHVFGGAGIVLGTLGLIITGYLIIMRLFFGFGLLERPLFLAGMILLILGVQFVAIGILADILLKIYYGQNQRKNYLLEKIV
ncbi:MAG: glycosyltransferase family 2 protein [Methanofollis sp.]|uniref:glycosyltransferase family 2 protein n=1 Tax=Methanofollis sp. TaxID=2052835 RepID=UPI00262DABE4|nr:glycosyltransferase family 2 protein [Methanofollis sp.]MDD4254480.1 glycosyltransferase family 2 protein [Methanofollis sp.]